jgi:hypothetical protein
MALSKLCFSHEMTWSFHKPLVLAVHPLQNVILQPLKIPLNIIFSVIDSNFLSPTLNVNSTLFVIPCKLFWGMIDLHYCNYCHLLSGSSSKFQSSMITFHHKLKEGRVLANGWTHPSSMTIFVHLIISVIQNVIIMTKHIMFSALIRLSRFLFFILCST